MSVVSAAFIGCKHSQTICFDCVRQLVERVSAAECRTRKMLNDSEALARKLHEFFLSEPTVIIPSWENMSDEAAVGWRIVADKLKTYLLGEEE